MLRYQDFIEQYSPKYGGLAKKIAEFMEHREISSLMGDDLYQYFGTKTAVTKTQFYVRRNAIIDFVSFTNDPNKDKIINRISNLSQVQLAKRIDESSSAYKSLDEVLDLLNQIVIEQKLHSTDATPLQSIAILMWLSYSNEDIVDFRVSDIDGLNNLDDKYKEIFDKNYLPRTKAQGDEYYNWAATSTILQNKYKADYPAHLHIDLLPEYQRKGWGGKLLSALFEHLRSKDIKGVMLTAGTGNVNAGSFYKKYGFEQIEIYNTDVAFGMKL